MTLRRSVLIQLLAIGLAIVMALGTWPFLPGVVPIHWNVAGKPDAFGSPLFLMGIAPFMIATSLIVTIALARGKVTPSPEMYKVTVLMAGLGLGLHGLFLAGAAFPGFNLIRPLFALIFGFFAILGPMLGQLKQNPWVGVRTPWTQGSRRVWRETHERTGRLWLFGGLAGIVLTLGGLPMLWTIAFLIGLCLWPVLLSYLLWKQFGRPRDR